MSMDPEFNADDDDLVCAQCNVPLEQIKVQATYMHSAFDVILPRCPKCGLTLVPQSLAEGKMAEVEALLEDK